MDRLLEERLTCKELFRRLYSGIGIPKIDNSMKEMISAAIQVNVGAGLVSYTYGKGTYGILPVMYSAISAGGLYNFFRNMRKNTQLFSFFRRIRLFSPWDLASGAFTFSTGVYAFSEALKRDDKIWIPCLVLAASGYYFAKTSICTSDRFMSKRPLMKSCQVILPTVLVASAATYIFYFRQHEEGWLKYLPFLITATTGLENANNGCRKDANENKHMVLLKVIEMFIGGCCLSISCIALAVYSAASEFFWPWTALMIAGPFYGAFVIFGSMLLLESYLSVDSRLLYPTLGLVIGPLIFSSAILLVECLEECPARHGAFLSLTAAGQGLFWFSFNRFRNDRPNILSLPVQYLPFERFRLKGLGPFLVVYGSMISAYSAYRFGWEFSLLPMSFIAAGTRIIYRGFVKMEEESPSE